MITLKIDLPIFCKKVMIEHTFIILDSPIDIYLKLAKK